MLWRFGLQHASNIDKLLEKEDLTLEEVLNDPDLLQEVREQNTKVVSYLSRPQNLKQMVDYIATEEFFKFSKMASTSVEVLCSNSVTFVECLISTYSHRDFAESDDDDAENSEVSDSDLDGLQAAYFSRIMCGLLQRKPYETLDFIRAQGNTIPLFLEHLGVTTVVDLLLKIISLEELDNGPGIIAWLNEYRLIPMLVDRLSPECDPEMHSLATQVLLDIIAISQCNNPAQPTIGTNALIEELKSQEMVTRLTDYMLDRSAPHATSTLINCVYIFIELIRRNYSDADAEMSPDDQGNGYGFGGTYDNASYDQQQQASLPRRLPTVDLSDMMRVLALRTKDLVELLKSPRSATEPVPTTMGLREPLGFERLRICELFAELLHCSNMPRLNMPVDKAQGIESVAVAISSPSDHDTSNTPVGQLLKWNLIQHGVLPICTDLFFRFSLNNFLHSVVYDIMHQVLNLPLTLECNLALIVVAFRDVRITSRIAQACAQNDQVCHEPRGVRLGYMGHLTGIGEEVARLLELSGAALEPLIAPFIDGDEWLDYVARTLQEVRERDQQPLGGERPGGTVDILASDNADQVFVSRMGLVDPSSGESYGPEDDDEDVDDEDMDEDDDEDDDDEDRYTASTRSSQGSAMDEDVDDDDDDDDSASEIGGNND
ncbi:SIT4 phosphatase-associated protein-domain-containing protein, partial [Kickxella alabastrina]|uniref:SIT4 phosphatase-associated protein-domain-containing protein n=1 Tax=Kickxella alabastrina TaxID=61397 RepID=UPI00221F2034